MDAEIISQYSSIKLSKLMVFSAFVVCQLAIPCSMASQTQPLLNAQTETPAKPSSSDSSVSNSAPQPKIVSVEGELRPERDESADEHLWLDDIQGAVSEQLTSGASWLDDWFVPDGDTLASESNKTQHETATDSGAKGFMRISLGWEPRKNNYNQFSQRVRLRLTLPNVRKRVALVFSDHDPLRDNSPLPDVTSHPLESESPYDFSLRLGMQDGRHRWTHRIGIGRGAQLYGRTAYSNQLYQSPSLILKSRTSLSWYDDDGWVARNELLSDIKLSEKSLLRIENNVFYEHRERLWLWQQAFVYFYRENTHTAWAFSVYGDGDYHPQAKTDEFLISIRRRQNILRDWLFYDIEPFVQWQRETDFRTTPGIALRVHGYFGH